MKCPVWLEQISIVTVKKVTVTILTVTCFTKAVARRRPKQQTLTVEKLVNHIKGDKVSVIPKTDPKKQ